MDVRVSSQRAFNRSPRVPFAIEAVSLFQKLRGFAGPAADGWTFLKRRIRLLLRSGVHNICRSDHPEDQVWLSRKDFIEMLRRVLRREWSASEFSSRASLYTSIFRPVSMESFSGSRAANVFSLGINSPWASDEPIKTILYVPGGLGLNSVPARCPLRLNLYSTFEGLSGVCSQQTLLGFTAASPVGSLSQSSSGSRPERWDKATVTLTRAKWQSAERQNADRRQQYPVPTP